MDESLDNESEEADEFRQATKLIASDLHIKDKDVEVTIDEWKDGTFLYTATGASDTYYFEFHARKDKSTDNTRILVCISTSSPPEENMFSFNETIEGFKTYERVATGAVHEFNMQRNPVILSKLLSGVPLYILGVVGNPIKAEIEVLLSGIPLGKGNWLEVFRFRHAEKNYDYYRRFSYIFKLHASYGSFQVAFPSLGALDSGGAYGDLKFAESVIEAAEKRGAVIKRKEYDIDYDALENFLLLYSYNFSDTQEIEIEVNQFRLPTFSEFGPLFSHEWRAFGNKFLERDYRGALGDIRPLVQDALKIACSKFGIDLTDGKNQNPNSLAGKLISSKILDGRLKEWFSAFTAYANIGSHSKIEPSIEDMNEFVIRKRIVLTILLGIHLVEEIKHVL